jgi:hypothetical protein
MQEKSNLGAAVAETKVLWSSMLLRQEDDGI